MIKKYLDNQRLNNYLIQPVSAILAAFIVFNPLIKRLLKAVKIDITQGYALWALAILATLIASWAIQVEVTEKPVSLLGFLKAITPSTQVKISQVIVFLILLSVIVRAGRMTGRRGQIMSLVWVGLTVAAIYLALDVYANWVITKPLPPAPAPEEYGPGTKGY